ncbi:MAG: hypothetical protein OSB62_08540 [Alphaproteobacteria bacterium]|nr:hypothetical protein [Alphaproteobacteria bacterium]
MTLFVSNVAAVLFLVATSFIVFSCADDFEKHTKGSVQVTL